MIKLWCGQIVSVVRLELKKTFFSKRGLWIYLLAFAPVALHVINSGYATRERQRLARQAVGHPISQAAFDDIEKGLSSDQVVEKLGKPYDQFSRYFHRGGKQHRIIFYKYTDGKNDFTYHFEDDKLVRTHRSNPNALPQSQLVFATSFQFYFLRLAIFFGCVGVFVNLFRGEMLDKSLHFYLLTPMRREVLLAGKYFAGLLATVVIFTSSTALQWWAMLWQFERGVIVDFLAGPGWSQFAAYLSVTALACVGYGSIFLAVGLLFRNPIVPTAVVLLWESANPFLPPLLKKTSMIYYLQSLCPVTASQDNLPPLMYLLISPTEPAAALTAVTRIVLLTLIVLVLASFIARKLEINYSTD
ncbi:MAG: ABC transporter permease subunit [Sedimentisphaerales bacterium]|nr:ABC transporter permease subunit [Sedimentisphaerales bacterium]